VSLAVLAAVLSLVCIGSSVADWKMMPVVVAAQERLRVPHAVRPLLPIVKVAGAAGLLIGLGVKGLGIAAAIGLSLYFLGASWFHVRAKDGAKDLGPAIGLTLLAVAVLVLRSKSS
jgi:hypothetical protein